MKIIFYLMLSVSLILGCGDSDDNGEPSTTENTNNETPSWTEVSFANGWTQMSGGDDASDVGPWIEFDDAIVPSNCDGSLEASADSAGLAWSRNADDDTSDNDTSNVGANSITDTPPTSVEDKLAVRPDLDTSPTPIFKTNFDGRIRDFPEHEGYERLVEIYDRPHRSNRISIDTCATVVERGGCYIPGDEFSASGCTASPHTSLGTLRNSSEFQDDDEDWTLSYRHGYECNNGNEVDPSHPEPDLEGTYFGDHVITLHDANSLAQQELIELDASDFQWDVSYRADRSCQDLYNPGPECTCTWAYREVTDTERAWAYIEDGQVAIELKGTGDDDEFFLWGQFDIQ